MNPAVKDIIELVVAVLVGFLSSSGVWVYMMKRMDRRTCSTKLLMGLAHDRITYLSIKYINRGYITIDEYEGLIHFLYEPYEELGGNSMAGTMAKKIKELPIKRDESQKKGDTA